MSTETFVSKLPTCDIHAGQHDAAYDASIIVEGRGRTWANVCEAAFREFGGQLGTGKGQRLLLPVSTLDRYQELMHRRELLQEAWMVEVDKAKAAGLNGVQFWTYGSVLGSTGGLRLTARDQESRPIFELALMPGETEVTRTEARTRD